MTLLKQAAVGNVWKDSVCLTGELVTWRLEVDNRNTAQSYVAKRDAPPIPGPLTRIYHRHDHVHTAV
jgi:hypothetical protein